MANSLSGTTPRRRLCLGSLRVAAQRPSSRETAAAATELEESTLVPTGSDLVCERHVVIVDIESGDDVLMAMQLRGRHRCRRADRYPTHHERAIEAHEQAAGCPTQSTERA